MVQLLERIEAGDGDARRARAPALGRLADPRQVALRARRLRRLPGRELPREVGRRVRGSRRAGPLPVRGGIDARGDRRAERRPHARGHAAGARMSAPRAGHAHDRRARGLGAEGHGSRRGGARRRDRDPGLLLRAAARAAGRRLPDVPLRGRAGAAQAAGGLHADRRRGDGRQDRAQLGDGGATRRTRRSSSSSSTIRSTARSATRAASARSRI